MEIRLGHGRAQHAERPAGTWRDKSGRRRVAVVFRDPAYFFVLHFRDPAYFFVLHFRGPAHFRALHFRAPA